MSIFESSNYIGFGLAIGVQSLAHRVLRKDLDSSKNAIIF